MHTRQPTRAVMAAFVAALVASPGFAQNPQSPTMGQQRPNEGVGSSARMPATTGTGAVQGQTDPGANLAPASGSAGTPGGAGTAGASSTSAQPTTNRALQEQGRGGQTAVPNAAGPSGSTAAGGQPAALQGTRQGTGQGTGQGTAQGTGGTPEAARSQGAMTQGTGATSPSAMGAAGSDQGRAGQSSSRQGISEGSPGTQATSPTQGVGGAPAGAGLMQPQGAAGQGTGAITPSRDANTRDGNTRDASAPVPGANSFTEGQARGRAEARGFTGVGELTKDDNGIWRGRAMQNGRPVEVLVDFQGNVTTR